MLQQLKASSTVDSGQIPTHVLRTHGIANIDRRRQPHTDSLRLGAKAAYCVLRLGQRRRADSARGRRLESIYAPLVAFMGVGAEGVAGKSL